MLDVLVIAEAVSVLATIHLWMKAGGSPLRKACWTPITLVPVLGPLLYGGMYSMPEEQAEGLQARETDTDGLA